MVKFNIKDSLLYTCCDESSIHGMQHLVQPARHYIERIFWLVVIILSILFAFMICQEQWLRYVKNPCALSQQTHYRNWEYSNAGVTICSNYTNDEINAQLVTDLFNVTENDEKYEYYFDFIKTVATTRYNTFETFERFANDTTLESVDLLEIIRLVTELPNNTDLSPVITEMGACLTSSQLYYYLNPYSNRAVQKPPSVGSYKCRSVDACKVNISPDKYLPSKLYTNMICYIHNEKDIIDVTSPMKYLIQEKSVIDLIITIDETTASKMLHRLQPESRSCLFQTEPFLPYFETYAVNVCKMNCKINAAIRLCGCIPFLYNVAIPAPKCTPKGLYCLSNTDWFQSSCKCPKLCESIEYVPLQTITMVFKYNRVLLVTTKFPKNRIKRNVLFTFEDLLVSFGGAAAFYLGCSFLSGVEIIFFIIEHIFKKIAKYFR